MKDEQIRIGAGDRAPDVGLRNEHGSEARLSQFWQERPAVLAFVRHFG